MRKKAFSFMIEVMLLAAMLGAQVPKDALLNPADIQIKIKGFAWYFGNSDSLFVSVELSWKGSPLSGATVRSNETVLTDLGGGRYKRTLTPYVIHLGATLVFSVEFPRLKPPRLSLNPRLAGRVILAGYRIANIIKWGFPVPGQVIDLGAYPMIIPLSWNFTGTPAKTKLIIKDQVANTEVFSKYIASEGINIQATTLKPGKEYGLIMWAVAPLDKFQTTPNATPDSDVVFYFNDEMTFRTKE